MKKNMNTLIKDTENEAVEAWHQAIGNRHIKFNDSIIQAGLFAERICQALYLREYGEKSQKTFYQLIQHFRLKGIFDIQMNSHMNDLRKPANASRHSVTWFQKTFIDICRLKMIEIIVWYQNHAKTKLQGLKMDFYVKKLADSAADTFLRLKENGKITEEEMYDDFAANERLATYDPEAKERLLHNPVFAGLIIDESGSMSPEKDKIIAGQNEAIRAIRGSMICKKKALYLMQHTFHEDIKMINSLTPVDKNGNDKVVMLNPNNYNPTDRVTYLYDTLHEAITLLIREADHLKSTKARKPEISIGILTDGEDYTSINHNASDINKLISELRDRNILKSAVVIGWTSKNLSELSLKRMCNDIGFDRYISFDVSDPKSIRDAFQFWSGAIEKIK